MMIEKNAQKTISYSDQLFRKLSRSIRNLQHLTAEALLEKITSLMFGMILLLGIPYFIYILIRFLLLSH
ncbi:hypothetical protein [Terrilactibacillus laevilacticus]|uniref:Uncharacterized protein n=1 Tax=Terrilactibacillus laevilacticus TaxID=1380157 RepID=A0ABW5PP63_9BACI|nr:hypothetical protein [Terrilactibacillus laevilacticus]